ncbi:MAG: response regulator transcription factor [Campylobacterota bacterium]|nr:response regulator transcription factor [Campylobacterota bacterium]
MELIKPTLLYVEDDRSVVEDVVFLLDDYFDKIVVAYDGLEAVEKFFESQPDIVILDINIPKLDGLEVATKIREQDSEVPIMFLTAHSERERLLRAIGLGVSNYLVKPFDTDEFKAMVEKLISKIENRSLIPLSNDFFFNTKTDTLLYENRKFIPTKKELELIKLLSDNRHKYFSACEIATELLSRNAEDSKCSSIVQLISRLKNKVLDFYETEKFFIENIYGVGYRIV